MRQVITGISGITLIKGKLNNLHIRIATLFYQSLNTVCHISKVFCDDFPVTKTCGNCTEQIDSRSFFPPSVFCCRIAIRNCIVFIKSTEMINPYNIIQTETIGNSFDPPFISGVTMHFPVIQRVSPELTSRGKSIRRASGHLCRAILLIEFEEPWVCPGIRTVHCYIDWNITNDLDSFFIGISFQFHPLLAEFKLHIFLKFNFEIHFFSVIIQCILPAKADILCPFTPLYASKTLLHSHKECIIFQPPCLFFLELTEFRIHINIASFICFTKKDHTSFI